MSDKPGITADALRDWRIAGRMTQRDASEVTKTPLHIWRMWEQDKAPIPSHISEFCAAHPADDPALACYRGKPVGWQPPPERDSWTSPERRRYALREWQYGRAQNPDVVAGRDLWMWRLASGMTQRECARRIGVPSAMWRVWEDTDSPLPAHIADFCIRNPPVADDPTLAPLQERQPQ